MGSGLYPLNYILLLDHRGLRGGGWNGTPLIELKAWLEQHRLGRACDHIKAFGLLPYPCTSKRNVCWADTPRVCRGDYWAEGCGFIMCVTLYNWNMFAAYKCCVGHVLLSVAMSVLRLAWNGTKRSSVWSLWKPWLLTCSLVECDTTCVIKLSPSLYGRGPRSVVLDRQACLFMLVIVNKTVNPLIFFRPSVSSSVRCRRAWHHCYVSTTDCIVQGAWLDHGEGESPYTSHLRLDYDDMYVCFEI